MEENKVQAGGDPPQVSVLMEEESAQVGKTWIGDILLARTMPLTEGENNVTVEESAKVGKSSTEDILMTETMPLSEDEYSGIEILEEESEAENVVDGIHQTHDVPIPNTEHDPAPTTPQDTTAPPNKVCKPGDKQQQDLNDPSPGTSSGMIRRHPRQVTESQNLQRIIKNIKNNTKEDEGWDPQLSTSEAIGDNLGHTDIQVLETLVEKVLERIVLSRNWGSGIAVPSGTKAKEKIQ